MSCFPSFCLFSRFFRVSVTRCEIRDFSGTKLILLSALGLALLFSCSPRLHKPPLPATPTTTETKGKKELPKKAVDLRDDLIPPEYAIKLKPLQTINPPVSLTAADAFGFRKQLDYSLSLVLRVMNYYNVYANLDQLTNVMRIGVAERGSGINQGMYRTSFEIDYVKLFNCNNPLDFSVYAVRDYRLEDLLLLIKNNFPFIAIINDSSRVGKVINVDDREILVYGFHAYDRSQEKCRLVYLGYNEKTMSLSTFKQKLVSVYLPVRNEVALSSITAAWEQYHKKNGMAEKPQLVPLKQTGIKYEIEDKYDQENGN